MSNGPKNGSKLLIIGIVAVVLLAIVAVVGGIFLLGSACCLGSMIFSSDSDITPVVTVTPGEDIVTLFDESRQVPEGNFLYYEISAGAGETLDISVTTDGSPVDVMVMNSEQFDEYQSALQGLNNGTWHTLATQVSVVSETITYTADEYGVYYVVFDNSENPADGAEARQDVNVSVVIDSIL